MTVCEDCGQQYHRAVWPHLPLLPEPAHPSLQGHEMLIKEIEAVEPGPTAPERA